MADTLTNLTGTAVNGQTNLKIPEVGADNDAWGGLLNNNWTLLDQVFKDDGTGDGVGLKVGSSQTLDATSGTLKVATPSGTTDATNKAYVDGKVPATVGANEVQVGPATGEDAVPSFRALVEADIPALSGEKITSGSVAAARVATLNQDTTGTSAGLSVVDSSDSSTQTCTYDSTNDKFVFSKKVDAPDGLFDTLTLTGGANLGNAAEDTHSVYGKLEFNGTSYPSDYDSKTYVLKINSTTGNIEWGDMANGVIKVVTQGTGTIASASVPSSTTSIRVHGSSGGGGGGAENYNGNTNDTGDAGTNWVLEVKDSGGTVLTTVTWNPGGGGSANPSGGTVGADGALDVVGNGVALTHHEGGGGNGGSGGGSLSKAGGSGSSGSAVCGWSPGGSIVISGGGMGGSGGSAGGVSAGSGDQGSTVIFIEYLGG